MLNKSVWKKWINLKDVDYDTYFNDMYLPILIPRVSKISNIAAWFTEV